MLSVKRAPAVTQLDLGIRKVQLITDVDVKFYNKVLNIKVLHVFWAGTVSSGGTPSILVMLRAAPGSDDKLR